MTTKKRTRITMTEGQVFGRLTFIREEATVNYARMGLFQCSCGEKAVIALKAVVHLHQASCGCLRSETRTALNRRRATVRPHPVCVEAKPKEPDYYLPNGELNTGLIASPLNFSLSLF